METGKYFEKNHKKLDSVADIEYQWAIALEKCREHIQIRLKRRTTYGAHTAERLGEDPYDYYAAYAYEAILSGRWEWKDSHTLSEQMILVADSTISTEVEKMESKKEKNNGTKLAYDDIVTLFYGQDILPDKLDMVKEILINKQVSIIEETIKNNDDFENLWECIKDGMKRTEIAAFMEKTPKQLDKIRERFIKKIKESPYFEKE